jgi:hypothetical protein
MNKCSMKLRSLILPEGTKKSFYVENFFAPPGRDWKQYVYQLQLAVNASRCGLQNINVFSANVLLNRLLRSRNDLADALLCQGLARVMATEKKQQIKKF